MRLPRWLDPRRIYQQPGRVMNPTGVRGGILTGQAIAEFGKRFGIDPETLINLETIATTPGVYGLLLSLGGDNARDRKYDNSAAAQARADELSAAGGQPVMRYQGPGGDPSGSGRGQAQQRQEETVVLPEVDVTQIQFGRQDPFAPVDYNSSRGPQGLETEVQPSMEPPTSGSSNRTEAKPTVESTKDDLISSAQRVRNEYDRLRQEDPEAAVAYGREQHKAMFPQFY